MAGVVSDCRLSRLAVVAIALMASAMHAATLTTLVSFNGANGYGPVGGLIADAAGNLYGTTWQGGANSDGVVFKFDIAAGELTVLASLGANNRTPYAGVIADSAGNLYGTTHFGGTHGYGTVFKFNAAAGDVTTLVSFNDANGFAPTANLIADADGNLYSTTRNGGAHGLGVVFKLDPVTGDLTTLVAFNDDNGSWPRAGLIADAAGNFYGTTVLGGTHNAGTVFKLDPVSGVLTTLASFNGANGESPLAALFLGVDGYLYGTTTGGGPSNWGAVFKLNPTTGELSTLVTFNGANGQGPTGSLIADADGYLYGTTGYGGANNAGTVFKIDSASGALSTLLSFTGGNGSNPFPGLIADAAGNLYGATLYGGGAEGYTDYPALSA